MELGVFCTSITSFGDELMKHNYRPVLAMQKIH